VPAVAIAARNAGKQHGGGLSERRKDDIAVAKKAVRLGENRLVVDESVSARCRCGLSEVATKVPRRSTARAILKNQNRLVPRAKSNCQLPEMWAKARRKIRAWVISKSPQSPSAKKIYVIAPAAM